MEEGNRNIIKREKELKGGKKSRIKRANILKSFKLKQKKIIIIMIVIIILFFVNF